MNFNIFLNIKYLNIFFLLLTVGCTSSRMIISPKGQTYVSSNRFVKDNEVTNKEYRQFLNDLYLKGDYEKIKIAQIDSVKWKEAIVNCDNLVIEYQTAKYNNYPVVNISYEGAMLYCEWLTERYNNDPKRAFKKLLFRLPTEQEWEFFANGGNNDYIFPFGNNLTCVKHNNISYLCNFTSFSQTYFKLNKNNELSIQQDTSKLYFMDKYPEIKPIFSYVPNDYGLWDFSGNAAEMVAEKGIVKGGGWQSPGYNMRIKSREYYTYPSCNIGFRVMSEIIEGKIIISDSIRFSLSPLRKISGLDFYKYFYKMAIEYESQKDYTNAIKYYTKSIEYNNEYVNAFVRRGNIYYNLLDFDKALIDFSKAIELKQPTHLTRIYTLRAYIYIAKNYKELALSDLNKSIEIMPNDYEAYEMRGILLKNMNRIEEACIDFKKAIELGCKNDKYNEYCR